MQKTEKKFTRRPAAGGASAVVVLFVGHCFGTVVVGAATFFWPPNDSWKIRAEERVKKKKEWKCKWTGNGLTLHRGGQTRSRLSRYVNDAWGRQCQQPVMLPARVSDGTTTKLLRTCVMRMIRFSRAVAEKERKDALLILSRPSRINKLSAYERYVYRYI